MSEDFYCEEVLSGRTPVRKVAETENVLAYHHTRPFWPLHVVVIPKRHIASLLTLEEQDQALLLRNLSFAIFNILCMNRLVMPIEFRSG